MVFSGGTFCLSATMMIVAVLALTTVNIVQGQSFCNDDSECSPDKYCYNVSQRCVEFTKCSRYERVEGSQPARQPSQCGPCRPGYEEGLLTTGVPSPSCIKKITETLNTEAEAANVVNWPWLWGSCISIAVILLAVGLAWLIGYVRTHGHTRIFEKVPFWNARPTAPPPQDDASYRLRGSSYPEEEYPPNYSSLDVDRDQLSKAVPNQPPDWVRKPPYDPDYNDNITDGAAMPIHSSSTNIQMELENEEETNPSSWTPDQLTVNVPTRPFALFASESRENAVNTALVRANFPPTSRHDESTSSDDGSEGPEDQSRARTQGETFCGPNVQINQTITLNIGPSGTK